MQLYLYGHASGHLSKVGLTTGSAVARQADYIASHQLVGFSGFLETFDTGAKSAAELRALEAAVHDKLAAMDGVWKSSKTGPREIFAVSPAAARRVILTTLHGRFKGAILALLLRQGVVTLGIVGGSVVLLWLGYEGWRAFERRQGRHRPSIPALVRQNVLAAAVVLSLLPSPSA